MRVTAVCDTSIRRVLQCVAPLGTDSSLRVITASTRASSMLRGAPERGVSSRPSRRCATKRARHLETVWGVTRSRAATSRFSSPSAQPSTMRARSAGAWAVSRRSVRAVSWLRCAVLSTSCVLGLPLMVTSSCQHMTRLIRTAQDSSMNFQFGTLASFMTRWVTRVVAQASHLIAHRAMALLAFLPHT